MSHGGISFPRGRGHEPIQLRILGNGVGERHQGATDPQQAVARLGVGDVAHLRVGDMQQLGKLHPVGGRLIEQQQKFGVRQHEPRRLGFQTFFHVLSGRRHDSGVLPKAFPRPVQKFP